MPITPEREILKSSLAVLRTVFKQFVKIERRQSIQFTNTKGQRYTVGKRGESDIGGWILKGTYVAKPIAIEVKRSDFRPTRVYGDDKKRFQEQCAYLREINKQGGVGFWVNDASMIYHILTPVLMRGSRVTLDVNNCVVVIHVATVKEVLTDASVPVIMTQDPQPDTP